LKKSPEFLFFHAIHTQTFEMGTGEVLEYFAIIYIS